MLSRKNVNARASPQEERKESKTWKQILGSGVDAVINKARSTAGSGRGVECSGLYIWLTGQGATRLRRLEITAPPCARIRLAVC